MDVGEAVYWLLLVLIIISVVEELGNLKERLKDLVRGIRGILFVPATVSILFIYTAFLVYFGIVTSDAKGHVLTYFTEKFGVSMVVFTVIACLLLNYYEEKYFRGNVLAVAAWAVLHLTVLVPPVFIPALFLDGLVYKKIKDAFGLETAYAAHFFHNMCILGFLVYSIYF